MSEEIKGWKLVPIEPTDGMLDVAEKLDWTHCDIRGNCCNQYQSMLAAAPAPSASVGMEPVGYFLITDNGHTIDKVDDEFINDSDVVPLYSSEQLATLQAKLEQADKDKAGLLGAIRDIKSLYPNDYSSQVTDILVDTLAKYEVKK